MIRKGNCSDNAVMESFFSRLKVELIYPKNYKTETEAKAVIFEYIEIEIIRTKTTRNPNRKVNIMNNKPRILIFYR